MPEIKYTEVARILECSPRNARRIIARTNIKPRRHGYRTVRFERDHILKLKRELKKRANGHLKIFLGRVQ